MTHPFNQATRDLIAQRCKAFPRLPATEMTAALKHAAVAITLVEAEDGAGTAFLLTLRATGLRAHSNQWALPGGRCDAGETVIDAALRELEEEVGLRLGADRVLGQLDDYQTRSGYLITPVVIWAGAGAHTTPNPQEVESLHRIPLSDIAPLDVVSFIDIPESERRVVRMYLLGNHVHAPTAALIYQFREMLAGRTTRVADLEQPVFAWQ